MARIMMAAANMSDVQRQINRERMAALRALMRRTEREAYGKARKALTHRQRIEARLSIEADSL